MNTINIGNIVPSALSTGPPAVFVDAPELRPHSGRPWLVHHIRERHGIDLAGRRNRDAPAGGQFGCPAELMERSATVVGAPGGGKTRLVMHLISSVLSLGWSVFLMDVQEKTIGMGVACALSAGIAPEQLTVLWPKEAVRGVPGFNPFAVELDEAAGAVDAFVDLLKESRSSWGVALDDMLRCLGVVVAAQKLSPLELLRAIQREDFRSRLLAQARACGAWDRYPEQHEYVAREFRDKGETRLAAANKLRGSLMTNPFLRRMMVARRDSLDIPGHSQRQRFTAVHLDASLGEDGTRLLSGLMTHALYQCAMARSGPVRTLLVVDELGLQARHSADALRRILAGCRQRQLSVLAACQHLDQVPPDLRTALMATALRVFFRVEKHDASIAAASLGGGRSSRPERVALTVTGESETGVSRIVDGEGRPLRLSPECWSDFIRAGKGSIGALKSIAALCGVGRLYVCAPTKEHIELARYVRGLPPGTYRIHGPAPIRIAITFPRPKVSVLSSASAAQRDDEAERLLQSLPVQHAVVRTDVGDSFTVRVHDVPFGILPDPAEFLGNGQSAEEIAGVEAWRRAGVEGRNAPRGGAEPAAEEADEYGNL